MLTSFFAAKPKQAAAPVLSGHSTRHPTGGGQETGSASVMACVAEGEGTQSAALESYPDEAPTDARSERAGERSVAALPAENPVSGGRRA